MKALLFIASFLVALVAWAVAVVDFLLARLTDARRPYLVPARTFYAAFRASRAFLHGQNTDWQTFRIRDYPHPKYF